MNPNLNARLACGCRVIFRPSTPAAGERPSSPFTVVVERKAETCTLSIHVSGMAVYDHRSALRPSTRLHPQVQPDYEDG